MENNRVIIFPCIEKNIGDDLFIRILCNRYPNVEFEISKKAEYGDLKDIHNLHFSKYVEKYLSYTGRVPHNQIKRMIYTLLEKYYRKKVGKYSIGIMIVGNAFKCYRYQGKNDSKWFEKRLVLTDNFYLMSTNFGPYQDERWREDFKTLFPRCKDICFRDKKSYEMFRELPNVRFAPDAVFSLGMKNSIKANRVIVSCIDCLLEGRPQWIEHYVYPYEKLLINIIDYLVSNGMNVVILNSNDRQDNPAAERIYNSLEDRSNVSVFHYNGNLNEVLDLYKESKAVLATRLHTAILGFLFDITVIPFIYDEKVEEMLNSIQFSGERYYIKDLESITVSSIINAISHYSFKISKQIISDSNYQFTKTDEILDDGQGI